MQGPCLECCAASSTVAHWQWTHEKHDAVLSPEVMGQLRADVSSPQQCAVVQEMLVRPLAEAASLLPGMPSVESSQQITLSHRKSVFKYTSLIWK